MDNNIDNLADKTEKKTITEQKTDELGHLSDLVKENLSEESTETPKKVKK